MKPFGPRLTTAAIIGLAVLVVTSLALNAWLVAKVGRTEDRVDQVAVGAAVVVDQAQQFQRLIDDLTPLLDSALEQAVTQLADFESSSLTFDVVIMESLPIKTAIPFSRTLQVPIVTTLPIDELIETTIRVQGPLDVEIPVAVEVPIRLDVPIDLTFPFTIDETIEVDTTIEVDLEVPVSIDLAGTELADLVAQLRVGLQAIQEVVAGL